MGMVILFNCRMLHLFPPISSADGITHSDADLHRYPRQSHRPPQRYADYVLH